VAQGFAGVTKSEGMEELMLEDRATATAESTRIKNLVISNADQSLRAHKGEFEEAPRGNFQRDAILYACGRCRRNKDRGARRRGRRSKRSCGAPGMELSCELT